MIARPMDFAWPLRMTRQVVPVPGGHGVTVGAGVAVIAVLWAALRLVG